PDSRGKSGLRRARWWVTPTLGNGFGLPGLGRQRAGQCNRKETAGSFFVLGPSSFGRLWNLNSPPKDERRMTKDEQVRVKRCGAKALNVRAHQQPGDRLARQTPPEARSSRGQDRPGPLRSPGRPLDPTGNRGAR